MIPDDWLRPQRPADGRVGACMTVRSGGTSPPPFDSLNLGAHVGDAEAHVAANRRRLADAIGARPVFTRQVHGTRVVVVGARDTEPGAPVHEADACVTTERGVACCVLVADCLPVLLSVPDGRGVAAAHAGWRGLAAGVLEQTLDALCDAARCEPDAVHAWLGACIGPGRFEVGPDVLEAFDADPSASHQPRFRSPDGGRADGKWLADLPGLAHDRLGGLGVGSVTGGTWCTVDDRTRFFSYRRDRTTGRMAACTWIR